MLSINKINFNTFQTSTKTTGATKPCAKNRVKILYFNDLHNNTDGAAQLLEAGKFFKQNNKDCATLILAGGDVITGGDEKKNDATMDLMQYDMNLDALVGGNHEFDGGLHAFLELMKNRNMHVVVTNAKFDDELATDVIKKSAIIEEKGLKFGVLGAMPLDFETCTKKAIQEGIEVFDFDDTVEALQKEINNLKKQGVDKIILLSHTGLETDTKLPQELSGVDIVIGGHSHSVVQGAQNGKNVVKSKTGEPVVIVQAGENGKHYGILEVEFDNKGILSKISNFVTDLMSKKSPTIEYIKEQKMGVSPAVGVIKEIEPMPENRRVKPHAWANLVVDSMKAEFGADCAFLNAANIRKVPAEGKLTERDITESAPMKNRLIRTQVTQKQVVDAIKQASKETLGGETGEPGLLFVSGFTYKVTQNGELLELNHIDKNGNKVAIDINNPSESVTYDAIYDDFTMQADGEYPHLAPKGEVQYFEYDKDKTAIDYISKMQNKDDLKLSDDKRIEIVQTTVQLQQDNNSQKFLSLTSPKAS